ncbi:hypothetical protein J3F83DRAFT_373391 [Trichoderma novae-zelandiae]
MVRGLREALTCRPYPFPLRRALSPQDAEVNFKVDFHEFYVRIEQALGFVLLVFGIMFLLVFGIIVLIFGITVPRCTSGLDDFEARYDELDLISPRW